MMLVVDFLRSVKVSEGNKNLWFELFHGVRLERSNGFHKRMSEIGIYFDKLDGYKFSVSIIIIL